MWSHRDRVRANLFAHLNHKNLQEYLDGNVRSDSILFKDDTKFYGTIKGNQNLLVNHKELVKSE